MIDTTSRHPAIQQVAKHFTFEHLPEDLQEVSRGCTLLAEEMLTALPDGPELTTGLRKLLEAKDCFVRAAVEDRVPDDGLAHNQTREG